jgi:flagellar biosynthesis/type III secretory pathway M-ring protein FliF/YscJ
LSNKLASLFTLMATVILVLTWLLRGVLGLPRMEIEPGMIVLLVTMVICYVFGRMVAWIGISLIEENLAERRAREEELRHHLRMIEQQAEEGAGTKAGTEEGAESQSEAETSESEEG